ncbi:MAG: hypothetical protein ACF8PN_17065 [Phycisphaerales bacterium]
MTGPEQRMNDAGTTLRSADELFQRREYASAEPVYEAAFELAVDAGNRSVATEAASQAGRCRLLDGDLEGGRTWLDRAREFATRDDPDGWSRYRGVLGRLQWKKGDRPTATKTFIDMCAYCESHDRLDRAIDAAHMVALTGDDDEQIEWARRGIQLAERSEHRRWLGPLWNNLGWNLCDRGEFDAALEALRNARESHYEFGDAHNRLVADWSVASLLRRLGRVAEARQALEPVKSEAQRRYREDPSADRAEWVGHCHLEAAELELLDGARSSALERMEEAARFLAEADMNAWDESGWAALNDRIDELRRELNRSTE